MAEIQQSTGRQEDDIGKPEAGGRGQAALRQEATRILSESRSRPPDLVHKTNGTVTTDLLPAELRSSNGPKRNLLTAETAALKGLGDTTASLDNTIEQIKRNQQMVRNMLRSSSDNMRTRQTDSVAHTSQWAMVSGLKPHSK